MISLDQSEASIQVTLLPIIGEGSSYHFATGYFNLTERFMRDITETRSTYSLLMAHPEANGFLGARFPIGGTGL